MGTTKQIESVSSVLKVFGILQALGEQQEIGITDIAQRLMMSKSTVYRFLQTMKTAGYVSQEGDSEKYSLTLKLFELGSKALEHVDMIALADRQMRSITKKTGEALHLGAFDDDAIIYIHKIDSRYNLRMYSRIGRRNPLYSTAIGKVLLAYRPEDEVRQILKNIEFIAHTQHTLKNLDAFIEELAKVRQEAVGEDCEEQEEGLRCLAVPVFDRFGVVIAGMSISFPTIRFDIARRDEYIAMLHEAAATLSSQLGYHDYPSYHHVTA
ncbi:DNA-binding transcriptional regulator KdgR [Celerinatantimonas yamalensis]|uniref:DNA-binding transcriptional regulator KdgR n=1 Tax=Celerinatantimonas yamalensis TaxID=559956 RepID=A0ABW9G8W6_9GAMM